VENIGMSFLDTLKNLFSKHKDNLPESMNSLDSLTSKLPEDMNSVEEIKAKAADVIEQHEEAISKVTDAIPGEADDQLVEKAKDAVQ
jgi:predicted transcriptional regulator